MNVGVISLDGVGRRIVLITGSLAPSRATRVGLSCILNFTYSVNNHASRASVVTHSLRLPTVINAGSVAGRIGGNSVLVLSTIGGEVIVGPSRTRLTRSGGVHSSLVTRGRRLTGLGSLPTVALSNRRIRIYNGVNAIGSYSNVVHGNNRNINLCHARFLFVSRLTLR